MSRVRRYLTTLMAGMIAGAALAAGNFWKWGGGRAVPEAEATVPRWQNHTALPPAPEPAESTPTHEGATVIANRGVKPFARRGKDPDHALLDELVHQGAREILAAALREEVDAYLARRKERGGDE